MIKWLPSSVTMSKVLCLASHWRGFMHISMPVLPWHSATAQLRAQRKENAHGKACFCFLPGGHGIMEDGMRSQAKMDNSRFEQGSSENNQTSAQLGQRGTLL